MVDNKRNTHLGFYGLLPHEASKKNSTTREADMRFQIRFPRAMETQYQVFETYVMADAGVKKVMNSLKTHKCVDKHTRAMSRAAYFCKIPQIKEGKIEMAH